MQDNMETPRLDRIVPNNDSTQRLDTTIFVVLTRPGFSGSQIAARNPVRSEEVLMLFSS